MRLLSFIFALLCGAQVLLAQPEKEIRKKGQIKMINKNFSLM